MGVAALLAARLEKLRYYSPYHFLRGLPSTANLPFTEEQALLKYGQQPATFQWRETENNVWFFYQQLAWDSALAGVSVVRLRNVAFDDTAQLSQSCRQFAGYLAADGIQYAFMEVPAEDTAVLHALTGAGWHLIETRLQYAHEGLQVPDLPRYPVRLATPDDLVTIREVARANANAYDRFHAEPYFPSALADTFLAEYAAAAVAGYCDEVLVPCEPGLPVDSFLAISYLVADAAALGMGLARVVLTAVGTANRGWHRKLLSETLYRAHGRGASAVLMTTQATNRAVIRNAEQLGFRLGATTHTLSWVAPKS